MYSKRRQATASHSTASFVITVLSYWGWPICELAAWRRRTTLSRMCSHAPGKSCRTCKTLRLSRHGSKRSLPISVPTGMVAFDLLYASTRNLRAKPWLTGSRLRLKPCWPRRSDVNLTERYRLCLRATVSPWSCTRWRASPTMRLPVSQACLQARLMGASVAQKPNCDACSLPSIPNGSTLLIVHHHALAIDVCPTPGENS